MEWTRRYTSLWCVVYLPIHKQMAEAEVAAPVHPNCAFCTLEITEGKVVAGMHAKWYYMCTHAFRHATEFHAFCSHSKDWRLQKKHKQAQQQREEDVVSVDSASGQDPIVESFNTGNATTDNSDESASGVGGLEDGGNGCIEAHGAENGDAFDNIKIFVQRFFAADICQEGNLSAAWPATSTHTTPHTTAIEQFQEAEATAIEDIFDLTPKDLQVLSLCVPVVCIASFCIISNPCSCWSIWVST